MLQHRQIQAFREVMNTGSLTLAAEQMGIGQPAVSRLIADLQKRTKLKLFRLTHQRMQPTVEALRFYDQVQKSYLSLERLEQVAVDIADGMTGRLNILAQCGLSISFVPSLIANFKRKYPKVSVQLRTNYSHTLLDWMKGGDYDLGLFEGPVNHIGFENVMFPFAPAACIMPSNHRLAKKRRIITADLTDENFVSLDETDPNRVMIDNHFRVTQTQRRITCEANAQSVLALVKEGLGVSVLSSLVVNDLLTRKRDIVMLPFQSGPFNFMVSTVRAEARPLSSLADIFRDNVYDYAEACTKEFTERFPPK